MALALGVEEREYLAAAADMKALVMVEAPAGEGEGAGAGAGEGAGAGAGEGVRLSLLGVVFLEAAEEEEEEAAAAAGKLRGASFLLFGETPPFSAAPPGLDFKLFQSDACPPPLPSPSGGGFGLAKGFVGEGGGRSLTPKGRNFAFEGGGSVEGGRGEGRELGLAPPLDLGAPLGGGGTGPPFFPFSFSMAGCCGGLNPLSFMVATMSCSTSDLSVHRE